MRRMTKLTALLAPLLTVSLAAAAPPKKIVTVEGITEYALDNGLRVLLFPDASKPSVTVNVTYFVGSRHEGYGETGMAHLLEHMTFKGTPTHPKLIGELDAHGARFNGTTSTDRTNYFETLQASPENLKWALSVEADRMVHAKISADDLKTEFSVVRNEFEINESFPESVLYERMLESAYLWHNYGKPTIGSRSDIERVPIENLRAFYTRYYQADNAMLVVAGKFDPAAALKEIEGTFGKLPRPKRTLSSTYTVEPQQDGERAVTLRRTGDVQVVGFMYHGVAGADADAAAMDALVDALTAKPSGRLYKALVETGLAARLDGNSEWWAEPGVFSLFASVRSDKSAAAVRDKIVEITTALAKNKITDEEVERFRRKSLRDIELGLTDPERVGVELSEWGAMGDWRLKFIQRDRIKALTAAQVQAFAEKYLKASNRTVGLFLPEKAPERAPLPGQPDVKQLVASYKGEEKLAEGEAFVATLDNIEKRTERVTLPNGMKLALLPKKTRGGAVELLLTVNAGDEKELRGNNEAARLVREAVLRGTKKHSYQQLRDELDRLKVEMKPSGSPVGGSAESSAFHLATVRASVTPLLALVVEVLREPTFPKDQIEALKKERLAGLESMKQQPMAAGFNALLQKATPWPKDDPRYVPSVSERIERLQAVTADDVAKFYKEHWGAQGVELVVVGDFDAGEVKAQLDKALGDWKAPRPWVRVPRPFRATPAGDETIALSDKTMAFVGAAVGLPLGEDDADFPALLLGNYIYGGSAKSRLFERLRERDGLSYGTFAFANANPLDKSGLFLAAAFCAPENAKKAMTGLLDELGRVLDVDVPESELAASKKAYMAKFDNDLSSDEALLGMLQHAQHAERTLAFVRDQNAKINALTARDVNAALKKYVRPDALVKIKAGDLK
jgi:zinc protease